jgi:argininosuccinate lyase
MLGTLCGLAPSYQRDLQITKQQAIALVEDALVSLKAFERAIDAVVYNREAMSGRASEGYTIATDVADALIARGLSARAAHAAVGATVAEAELAGRALGDEDLGRLAALAGIGSLDAPLSAAESVRAKKTAGSTSPDAVRAHLDALRGDLAALEQRLA